MITKQQALEYECSASWWAGLCYFNWMADLAARYFFWKVTRKWRRYECGIIARISGLSDAEKRRVISDFRSNLGIKPEKVKTES